MTMSAPKAPLAPPDEQFWQRYSPHHEFSLSSIGSIAAHIGMFVLVALVLWLLSTFAFTEKSPVPIREMTVSDSDGDGNGLQGQGNPLGGPAAPLPAPKLPDLPPIVVPNLPEVPVPDSGLDPSKLPSVNGLLKIPANVRNQLPGGKGLDTGSGVAPGSGQGNAPGAGPNSKGNASSSASRAIRWELVFRTTDGHDYLRQLSAMKAVVAIPTPPDWSSYRVFKDLSRPMAEPFVREQLPMLYFIDGDNESASRLTKALGLDFEPPNFIAFFPKEIEEELAAKERAFWNRKESEIFSTKFKIVVRDGKPSITVVDQVPIRR